MRKESAPSAGDAEEERVDPAGRENEFPRDVISRARPRAPGLGLSSAVSLADPRKRQRCPAVLGQYGHGAGITCLLWCVRLAGHCCLMTEDEAKTGP